MALRTAQVAVGTAPVELTVDDSDGRLDSSLAVQAPATATLYVGGSEVSASTGWPIPAGQSLALDIRGGERLYGVLADGAGTAYVLRTGV